MNIQDKYAQAEVVAFWTRLARSGLQRAESRMIERYAPAAPARVLDIGCGAGRVTLALAPYGYHVVGLDLTAAMVRAARTLARERGLAGEFVQGDLCALSFAAGSFDVALIFIAALQHVAGRAQRRDAFRQIARSLKLDGVLILALDNIAPALRCYASWVLRKLPTPIFQDPASKPTSDATTEPFNNHSVDEMLAANRTRMSRVAWRARGLARSVRGRTWEGVRDAGRTFHLVRGERGDTAIAQVSMPPTDGKVFYHLYRHAELIADARVAGLRLFGYHSGNELADGKTFGATARQLDKQVMYAFKKVG